MSQMFYSFFRIVLSFVLVLSLGACSANRSAGLEPFQSTDGRYGFLYPTGWIRVSVNNGPAVAFHDLINSDETLSLVISKLNNEVDLESLGGASVVGERFINQLVSNNEGGPKVDLLQTKEREYSGHIFYDLEYTIDYLESHRHELATVVLDKGNLYTFSTGASENRWPKVNNLFERVITSFTFLS